MLKLTATACIDLPVRAVWAVLSGLDAVQPFFERLAAQSLASLKDYVEHGSLFPGRARDLAPAPAGC